MLSANNYLRRYGMYGYMFLILGGILSTGCTHITHKQAITREEALKLVDFPLPLSAVNIFFYEMVDGLQSLSRYARFDIHEEELEPAIESIIADNNTRMERSLAYARKNLPAGNDALCFIKGEELDWWNPDGITRGYYRGEVKSYAVQLWIDEGVCFKLTEEAFKKLADSGVPQTLLDNLTPLQNQACMREQELLDVIEQQIGKEQTMIYADLILKHTDAGICRIYLFQSD